MLQNNNPLIRQNAYKLFALLVDHQQGLTEAIDAAVKGMRDTGSHTKLGTYKGKIGFIKTYNTATVLKLFETLFKQNVGFKEAYNIAQSAMRSRRSGIQKLGQQLMLLIKNYSKGKARL